MLRRPEIAAELDRHGPGVGVINTAGKILHGEHADGDRAEIRSGGEVIGHVTGPNPHDLARMLGFLADRETELRALARESLDRYKELTMLYSISEKVIGARSHAEIAQAICDEASGVLGTDSVTALILNAESGRLEVPASSGAALLERSGRDLGSDIIAAVIRSGVGEIVNEVAGDSRSLDGAQDLAAIVCSPMKSGDRVIGVLVAGSREGREFNAGDLQILNAMAAHCAAVMEVARLDRDLKAKSGRPVDLVYGVDDKPPASVIAVLGIQHVLIAMMSMAYPVLITLEAGGTRLEAASVVAMSLIAMAIATAIQTLRTGFVGSGYLAPYITSAIYLGPSLLAARIGGLGLVFGMTIVAGFIALGLSQILRRFRKLFPPEVSGVVVLMVGISMVPVALERLVGIGGEDQLSEPGEWLTGLITLAAILLFTVLTGRIRLYATAIGLGVGYSAAVVFGLFSEAHFSPVADLPMIGLLPLPSGDLAIEPLLIIPFVAAALASNVKDAGLLISAQKINDTGWRRVDTASMSGGLVAGGLGTMAAGALGGVGLGISGGSVGLAAATGATARVIGLAIAGLFLLLAFLPKAAAIVALMPSPVMGAGLIYVACHLVSSGTEMIASRMLDARRIYVIGLPLLAGVGIIANPEVAGYFPLWAAAVVGSPLATATILALGLNLALNVGVSSRANMRIDLSTGIGESITRFVEGRAASWGARRDVIDRAVPAITDWCEELRDSSDAKASELELFFDDFHFVATIRTPDALVDRPTDAQHLLQMSEVIGSRYGCGARMGSDSTITLVFEH